jgi:6-phosphogluconolactonase
MAITDKAGKFLFVPCLGSDHIAVYRIDATSGKLSPNSQATVPLAKGAGPRHLAFAPDERRAYVINELNATLTSFAFDAATGVFSAPATVSTLPAGFSGKNSCAHVVVSPDGASLYGSNRGHDSLVICRIDPASGALTVAGHETGGGEIKTPRNFTLDPSGTLALVASQGSDLVTVFRVDAATGKLERLGSQKVGPKPSFVGVMPRP